jgi:hypothetical protein
VTIPASTMPAAMLYLLNQITTAVNDTTVLVSYGPPGPNQPDDLVAVGTSVTRETVPYQMVGSGQAGWLDEHYDIDIVVSVYRGGDNGRTVLERAAALVDTVVSVVRTDPSLGGAVVVAHPSVSSWVPSYDLDHKGRVVDVTVIVSCRARI